MSHWRLILKFWKMLNTGLANLTKWGPGWRSRIILKWLSCHSKLCSAVIYGHTSVLHHISEGADQWHHTFICINRWQKENDSLFLHTFWEWISFIYFLHLPMQLWVISNVLDVIFEVFVNNTNLTFLTFLYKLADLCWIGDLLNEFCFMHHFIFLDLDHFSIEHDFIRIRKFETFNTCLLSTVE